MDLTKTTNGHIAANPLALRAPADAAPDVQLELEAGPRWRLAEAELPAVDILIVTCNSARHLEKLIASLGRLHYPADRRRLVVIDNASTDDSVAVAERAAAAAGLACHVVRLKQNVGFGAGMNAGARVGDSRYVFLLNPDAELDPDCLRELVEVAETYPAAGQVEARQFPYEHPKLYNPVTLETRWCSGAACLVRRDAFAAVGGFDEALFLYCEDVDLSWRLRAKGYRCYYAPRAVAYHYSYEDITTEKPLQARYTTLHNLFLRCRYGRLRSIAGGYLRLARLLLAVRRDPVRRKWFKHIVWKHLAQLPAAWRGRRALKRAGVSSFFGWDYEFARPGAGYVCRKPAATPLVSVVIRTHRRPTFLREALASVMHQTYPAVEAVVAEDGSCDGEPIVREFAGRLQVRYLRLPPGSGTLKTGNAGVAAARGEYVLFLDDDDLLFADHVETLIAALQREGTRVAYALGMEAQQTVHSLDPLRYEITKREVVWDEPFQRLRLLHHNYLPIQTVLFERRLFYEVGGLDESLTGYLEDWDLWIRFALRVDRFSYVPKVTSEYRRRVATAAEQAQDAIRQRGFEEAYQLVMAKYRGQLLALSVAELNHLMSAIDKLEHWTWPSVLKMMRSRGLRWMFWRLTKFLIRRA